MLLNGILAGYSAYGFLSYAQCVVSLLCCLLRYMNWYLVVQKRSTMKRQKNTASCSQNTLANQNTGSVYYSPYYVTALSVFGLFM